jgi:nitrogen regulatory protein P-II 1
MKKLEIIIKPERLEELKTILEACGASGVMVNNLMGYGNQKGYVAQYRGTQYMVNLLPKISVTTVTQDDKAEIMISRICQQLAKGAVGDGKIFVYDVVDAIRIRTGERGDSAL